MGFDTPNFDYDAKRVLTVVLDSHKKFFYSSELAEKTLFNNCIINSILAEFKNYGWVSQHEQQQDEVCYELTESGRALALKLVESKQGLASSALKLDESFMSGIILKNREENVKLRSDGFYSKSSYQFDTTFAMREIELDLFASTDSELLPWELEMFRFNGADRTGDINLFSKKTIYDANYDVFDHHQKFIISPKNLTTVNLEIELCLDYHFKSDEKTLVTLSAYHNYPTEYYGFGIDTQDCFLKPVFDETATMIDSVFYTNSDIHGLTHLKKSTELMEQVSYNENSLNWISKRPLQKSQQIFNLEILDAEKHNWKWLESNI